MHSSLTKRGKTTSMAFSPRGSVSKRDIIKKLSIRDANNSQQTNILSSGGGSALLY